MATATTRSVYARLLRPDGHVGRSDRGAVLVEFALVVPLLVMLLVGIVTAGAAWNQQQQLTHAVREGARYAAMVPPDQAFASGTWASNVRDLVVERAVGQLSGEGAEVCVSLVRGSAGSAGSPLTVVHSTGSGACIPGQTYPVTPGDDGLRVQVRAERPGRIDLAVVPGMTFTITSEATALSESRS